jgi:hypothetical protein
MPSQQSGDQNSDLWISLEDAVEGTGVSKRTIQGWVRSGEVKREKRKGKTYLWVADLTAMTPLTRSEPSAESAPQEDATPQVILPEVMDSYVAGASMKAVGERLKENRQLQEKILERLEEVGGAIELVKEKGMEPVAPALDERTVKELSLLGNVFRSIHQQNEKVSKALEGQEELLKNLEAGMDREIKWTERWMKGEKSLLRWKVVALILVVLMIASGMVAAQFYLNEMDKLEQEQALAEEKRREIIEESEARERDLLLARDEHKKSLQLLKQRGEETVKHHKLQFSEEVQRLELEKARALREQALANEKLLRERMDEKERLLKEVKDMAEKQRLLLEARYKEELRQSESSQQKGWEVLNQKIQSMEKVLMQDRGRHGMGELESDSSFPVIPVPSIASPAVSVPVLSGNGVASPVRAEGAQ